MRFLLISVTAFAIATLFFMLREPQTTHQLPLPSVSPTVTPSPRPPRQSMDIEQNGETYRIAWVTTDPGDLTLIPNFTQKRTAKSLIESKECDAVMSGGFYTKDNQPTGLFITEGTTIRSAITNTLLNGYFVVDTQHRAAAQIYVPAQIPRIGLQTGPVLLQDGNAMKLTIRDDEFARRVVVATDTKGNVVFLVVYNPDNPYEGPTLADLPGLVAEVNKQLEITDAINLDGGSASAFIRSDLSLEELTSVGSFFCIKL